ncbi:thiamine pyrophosphate-binding protein [Streptomyces sparsogenes]|uniref:thiamine pyrophosphate-binding protein n=1 Tax=Streptomyces sparsogenes TaxID=67365 RepID=UPI0033FC7491
MADVSGFVAARMRAWGVDRVFGIPERNVDALVAALRSGRFGVEFVQARHAESAALMACAHAKLTGRTGCCLAASGVGTLHLLTGLYDAALDRQPVVAVVGVEAPSYGTRRRRRTVRTLELSAEVCEFAEVVSEPSLMGDALDRAFRAALTDRGPAVVLVSRAVLESEAPGRLTGDPAALMAPVGFDPPAPRPRRQALRRAAEVLNGGRRVAIVVGQTGARASGQVVETAGLLGAGIAKTPLARDVLPDDLPCVAGVAGPLGSTVAAALLRDCDTLLLVGATDLDPGTPRRTGSQRVVSIDTEAPARRDGAGPADVEVTADVPAALDELIPLLRRKRERGWRKEVERAVKDWRAEGRTKAKRFFGATVSPRAVVAELSERLPEGSVVITDTGSAMDWWTRHLELRSGMRATLSHGLAAPGASVPYAVAARLAFPDRPVIALVGDGALQTSSLNELVTVRGHLGRFAEQPPLVFCVLNNRDRSRLTWRRRTDYRDPLLAPSREVPDVSYAEYARLLGLAGVRCDRPGAVGEVWTDILGGKGPVVLEFVVDGETAPDWAEEAQRGHPAARSVRRLPRGRLRRLIGTVGGGLSGPSGP